MTTERSALERLGDALYGGPVKAADFKVTRGTGPDRSPEALAGALLASMERVGLVREGRLVPFADR